MGKRKKGRGWLTFWSSVMAAILCLVVACKESDSGTLTYDPNKPVEITGISPKSGSAQTRLFVFGKNFGTDVSLIAVKIGGLDARVIGSNGDCIYCVVPKRAFEGSVEVTIHSEDGDSAVVKSPEKFDYERKTMVETLCGRKSETGDYSVADGPFSVAGFSSVPWLSFDPQNPGHLYLIEEKASIRLIDLKNEMVSTVISRGQMKIDNPRTITWSSDGEQMVVSNSQTSEIGISNVVMNRGDGFEIASDLSYSKSCYGSAVHPVNGEIYFTQWAGGAIWQQEFNSEATKQKMFNSTAYNCQVGIVFHPTGNYAYLIQHDKACVKKSNYNWEEKRLEVPNVFVGDYGKPGYKDGVGTSALLNQPWQGCFVKNEEYVRRGDADQYDFYLCDRNNHAIRKITPTGVVTTFAGRGSFGLDGKYYGYIDGDLRKEARFNQPTGIAYDETTKTFYIADLNNKRIRMIVVEDENVEGENNDETMN